MPVDIQEIENQKENIAPLREGRSAAALAETFASTPLEAKTSQHAERQQFEELLAGADELDDPLEPYLDYIRWVNDKFPQGHTAESGLIPLLERCTSQFRDTSYYKNDPRYLRVWMTYVKYSDAPKELFTYLSRKDIGQQLSTYYEEYASYLEANGRKLQADEVYKRGIDLEARPLERLKRRYREFLERLEANPPGENEPSSPAMPTVRQALAQKEARSDTFESEPTSRGRSDKIQVFTDSGDSAPAVNAGGWDTIGSLASRRKENVMEARPWAGEKLKQQVPTQISSKMSIYRDMPAIPQPPQPVPGKRPERLKVALEFLYDENGEDYCIEEVLARARRTADAFSRKPESPKSHMMTVPLKDSSPKVPGSPTMTMHTKAATAEIYDMFNQPLKDGFDDDDNQTGYSINYDVTETNFTNNNQLDSHSEPHDKTRHDKADKDAAELEDVQQAYEQLLIDVKPPMRHHSQLPFMTPISEATETVIRSMKMPNIKHHSVINDTVINPLEDGIRTKILKSIDMKSFSGYSREPRSQASRSEALKRSVRGNKLPSVTFSDEEMYCLRRILGEGGYGIIYLAESATDGKIKALKIEKNALPWEFYILKTIELRCSGSRELDSLVRCERAYAFDDEVYLLLDYHPQGTVLDMFNLIQSDPMAQGVEECFVLFLAVELLRVVESLHKAGIIHCDLKPDNVMLRLERISNDAAWSKYYSQDGSNKWAHKGIALIDFGRAIDMTLLRPDVQFVADWVMDELDCIEMQENRKWTYQADYYGIASVLHLLLFDRDISVAKSADGSYKLTSPFKRYWQKDLWAELFDALLNSAAYGQLPITSMLTECRRKIEKRLEDNAMPLKESIQRIEELISRRNTH